MAVLELGAALVGTAVAVAGLGVGAAATAAGDRVGVGRTAVGSCRGICAEVGAGSGVPEAAKPAWFSGGTGVETGDSLADSWPPPQAEIIRTVTVAST